MCTVANEENNNNLPLHVLIGFRPNFALSKSRVDTLAQEIANFVSNHIPAPDKKLEFGGHKWEPHIALPTGVTVIYIDHYARFQRGLWGTPTASWVQSIESKQIEVILAQKNPLCDIYRAKCDEIWLVIFVGGTKPSSIAEAGGSLQEYKFETKFDRVFLLDNSSSLITELVVVNS